jgi:predicted dehydrogenase
MIATASEAGAVLAVGLDFRFFCASKFMKQALDSKLLGNIISFDLRQGVISQWPSVSDSLIRKDGAGGGVLIDFGVHVLDLLLWWLGDYDSFEYYDDAMGGVEADCELYLRLQCGASGSVELSRTRNLRNTCIIRGELGALEIGIWETDPLVQLKINDHDVVLSGRVEGQNGINETWQEVFRNQLDDFVDAARHHREPFIPGHEGKRSIKLIEACYHLRQLRKHPWVFPKFSRPRTAPDNDENRSRRPATPSGRSAPFDLQSSFL